MTIHAWIAVATICVSIFGSIMGHVIISVWWASKISTTLDFLQRSIIDVQKHQDGYYPKEDAVKDLLRITDQLKAMWIVVDEMKNRIAEVEKNCYRHHPQREN